MMTSIYLVGFIASLLFSFVFTRAVRNLAVERGWVSTLPLPHHIHNRPIPRLGGVAIFLSFVAVITLVAGLSVHNGMPYADRNIFFITLAGLVVFLLGLYDDIYSASPCVKVAVQALAACLLYFGEIGIFNLPPFFGMHETGWLGLPLTILWVLWITNAFNLIDGLDGLAAGSALFSTLTVFAVCLIAGNDLVSFMTIALAGAILGFLRFNFNPATIFLGDSGSLFIGFMLSALALASSQKAPTLVAVGIPIVSFGLPVLETMISVIRRWLNGQPLFTADREHIHHKLLARGLSQRQAVILLYAVSAVCGLMSLFLLYPGRGSIGIVLFVLGLGIWIGVQHLGYHEFFELRRVANRTMEQKRIIINNLAIRKVTEALHHVKDFHHLRQALENAFKRNEFDAFQLRLSPALAEYGQSPWLDFKPAHGAESIFEWRKAEEGDLGWVMTLDLVTSDGRRCGQFYLLRNISSRPLLIDVNLLISEFPCSLADACVRAAVAAEQQEVIQHVQLDGKAAGTLGLKTV